MWGSRAASDRSVSPLLNESGEVNGAVIMLRDVTREWQQQTFLRISINALQSLLLVL